MTTTGRIQITVRLDQRVATELDELVAHFTEQDALGREITAAEVTRGAIHALYVSTLGKGQR